MVLCSSRNKIRLPVQSDRCINRRWDHTNFANESIYLLAEDDRNEVVAV
jgi:hypothetical protein